MSVPRFVGLMVVDAREAAAACGLVVQAPDEPEFALLVTAPVMRQFPPPGTEVPRGAVITLWCDPGDQEGGGGTGVREPRTPRQPSGGLRGELDEPGDTAPPPGDFRDSGDSGEWALPVS